MAAADELWPPLRVSSLVLAPVSAAQVRPECLRSWNLKSDRPTADRAFLPDSVDGARRHPASTDVDKHPVLRLWSDERNEMFFKKRDQILFRIRGGWRIPPYVSEAPPPRLPAAGLGVKGPS